MKEGTVLDNYEESYPQDYDTYSDSYGYSDPHNMPGYEIQQRFGGNRREFDDFGRRRFDGVRPFPPFFPFVPFPFFFFPFGHRRFDRY